MHEEGRMLRRDGLCLDLHALPKHQAEVVLPLWFPLEAISFEQSLNFPDVIEWLEKKQCDREYLKGFWDEAIEERRGDGHHSNELEMEVSVRRRRGGGLAADGKENDAVNA